MRTIRYNKYLLIACIYFFINQPPFFPPGLAITTIISPALYLWLLVKRRRFVLEKYFAFLFPFAFADVIQATNHTAKVDFIVAAMMMMTVFVAAYAIAVAIQGMTNLEQLMQTLIKLNLAWAFVGLLVRFTPLSSFMWQIPNSGSESLKSLRFSGLTTEPAQYTLVLAPLVLYSYWRVVKKRNRANIFLLIATLIPLGMSLSAGGIIAMTLSLLTVYLIFGRGFTRIKWALAVASVLVIGFFVLPTTSTIRTRAIGILTGNDNSGNIRTTESYLAAYAMAKSKDIWFGAGMGEAKDLGHAYMQWNPRNTHANLPSAIAGTLGELGLAGLALRFGLEIFFFFKTKPYTDQYRLSLFFYAFILQFGMSNRDNVAEYVVWILAFSKSAGFFSQEAPQPVPKPAYYAVPQLT